MSWSIRWSVVGVLALIAGVIVDEASIRYAASGRSRKQRPRAVLLFEGPEPSPFSGPAEHPSEPDREREIATQMVTLTSDPVLGQALARLSTAKIDVLSSRDDPMVWIRDHLVVEHEAGTPVVEMSLPHGTPEEQAALLNGILDSYRQRAGELELSKHRAGVRDLEDYQQRLDHEIEGVKQRILELATRDARVGDLSGTRHEVESRLLRLGHEKAEVAARTRAARDQARPGAVTQPEAEEPGRRLEVLDAQERLLRARLEEIKREAAEQAAAAVTRDFLNQEMPFIRSLRDRVHLRTEGLRYAEGRRLPRFWVAETPSVGRRGPN